VWEIELYEKLNGRSPVLEFIGELHPKEQAKVIREIDLLAEFGPSLIYPHTRKIEGAKNAGLWELRVHLGTNAFRIFYIVAESAGVGKYVLLHGFKKKTDKTPENELEKARNRQKAYLEGSDEVE
jgi:phage-related protein